MSSSYTASPFPAPHLMLHALARNWWLMLLRGICAILFGVLTFVWPGLTLVTLILLYGAYALVDGVCAIAAAITGGTPMPRLWLAIVGLIGIVAGLVTFFWPGMTALVLLYFVAGWMMATGVMQIVGAIRLRKEIENEWNLIIGGILAVLFGLVLFTRPEAGALALAAVIGIYAVAHGILLVFFALRLRRHVHPPDETA